MKRLNKKGFTLVELLAAIVILAVLMLAGASAVGGIMRSSRANSLKSSLDAAVKQAQTSYAQDELAELQYVDLKKFFVDMDDDVEINWNDLSAVLDYEKSQYDVAAGYYSKEGKEYIIVAVGATSEGSFKSVRCNHGKMNKEAAENPLGTEAEFGTDGYYCVDGTEHSEPATFIRIKKITN